MYVSKNELLGQALHYAGWRTSQWDFSRPPIYFTVGFITADDTTPVDWSALFLPRQSAGTDLAWQEILANVQSNMGSTWGQYVLALGNLAQKLYEFTGGSASVVDADTLEFYLLQGAGEISTAQPNSAVPLLSNNSQNLMLADSKKSAETTSEPDPSPGTIYCYSSESGSWTELAPDAIIDPNLPTVVIIHGWNDKVDSGWEAEMASAIHSTQSSMNILAVDWRIWAKSWSIDPWTPATHIPKVAHRVAWRLFGSRGAPMAGESDLILGLGLRPENTHLIGHSHGAHVAGLAAEYSRYEYRKGTVRRVTALDPSCEYSHLESGNLMGGGWGNYGRSQSAAYIDAYRSSKGGPWFRTYGDDNFLLAIDGYSYDDSKLSDPAKHFWAYQWFTQTIIDGGGALGLGFNWGTDSWAEKTAGFQFNGTPGPWKGLIRGGSIQHSLEGMSPVVEDPSAYSGTWQYPGAWGPDNWESSIISSLAHSVEFQPISDSPPNVTWPAGGTATVSLHIVDNSDIKSISRVIRQSSGTQLADSIYRLWLSRDTDLNKNAAINVSGDLFLYPDQWTTPEDPVKSISASAHLPSIQDIANKWGNVSLPATFYLIVEISPSRLSELYPDNNRCAIKIQINGEDVSAYVQQVLESDVDGNGVELVHLDGTRSGPKDKIVKYLWILDGNFIKQGALLDTLDVNVAVGLHTVELIVTDNNGIDHSAQASVIIQPGLPQPPFISGGNGNTIGGAQKQLSHLGWRMIVITSPYKCDSYFCAPPNRD